MIDLIIAELDGLVGYFAAGDGAISLVQPDRDPAERRDVDSDRGGNVVRFPTLATGWLPPLAARFGIACNWSLWASTVPFILRVIGHGFWWVPGRMIGGSWASICFWRALLPELADMAMETDALDRVGWRRLCRGGYRALPQRSLTCTFLSVDTARRCGRAARRPHDLVRRRAFWFARERRRFDRSIFVDAGHHPAGRGCHFAQRRGPFQRRARSFGSFAHTCRLCVADVMYHRPSRATDALREFFACETALTCARSPASSGLQPTVPANRSPSMCFIRRPRAFAAPTMPTASFSKSPIGGGILLTGDLEGGGLARVIELPPRKTDVLFALTTAAENRAPKSTVPTE